jgi:hypothetical protein
LRGSVHREAEPKCVIRTGQSNQFQSGSMHRLTKIPLICSQIIWYFKMKYNFSILSFVQIMGHLNIYIKQKFSALQFNMRNDASLIQNLNKILKYSTQKYYNIQLSNRNINFIKRNKQYQ